jgi:hypothetical protein
MGIYSGLHLYWKHLLLSAENPKMTDERKYALLFAATILAARKLASLDTKTGPTPAKICAVENAIDQAKFILDRIEARWPEPVASPDS